MEYNAIFFDIGNTLFSYNYEFLGGLLSERFDVNKNPIHLEETHKRTQRELVEEGVVAKEHDEIWDWTYRRWLTHMGCDEAMSKRIMDAIRNHPFNHLFWTRMEDGVPEMLTWFKERGFKLGVISNAEGQIEKLIKHVGLDSKFDVIADSGEVGITKPDEGIFRFALEKVGADPSESLYVGDQYRIDVVGARNAGMTPILVERHYNEDERSCITVARASDLPALDIFRGI